MERQESVQKIFARKLAAIMTPLLLGYIVLATLPIACKPADLASHFLPQAAAVSVVMFLLALYGGGNRLMVFLLAIIIGVSLWPVMPFVAGASAYASGPKLKVLQANVLYRNRDTVRLQQLIEKETPDVVVLSELTPAFAEMMKNMKGVYPYQDLHPDDKAARGLGVMSKLDLLKAKTVTYSDSRIPAQMFEVAIEGQPIIFVSLHPVTPVENLKSRDADFSMIADKYTREPEERLVLLGDFNATPWCRSYRSLVKALNLKNAAEGRGIFPTWPAGARMFPARLLRIPIDHLLLTDTLTVADYRTGPDIGSDHLPVITTLGLRKHL